MNRAKRISIFFSGVSIVSVAFFTPFPSDDFIGGNRAEATQPPPPPTYYELTVSKSGGDSSCEVRILSPEVGDWTSTSDADIFIAGSEYEPEWQVICPSNYRFSHWESNDENLHGCEEHHGPPISTLTQDTVAIAVFERIVPDSESTTWHDHYTQNPHWGDMYWHQVSSSSNPTRSFAGLVINEDFLIAEMDTSDCSMTLTQEQKEGFQNSWDSDSLIDSNNYRKELNGDPPPHRYDSHGFNPDAAPWNQIQSDEVFRLTQRMRAKGCPSTNNQGPWFATHSIHFKVIYNTELAKREVFVKKSGVQGTGDPSF